MLGRVVGWAVIARFCAVVALAASGLLERENEPLALCTAWGDPPLHILFS